jgi:hypothetical protein
MLSWYNQHLWLYFMKIQPWSVPVASLAFFKVIDLQLLYLLWLSFHYMHVCFIDCECNYIVKLRYIRMLSWIRNEVVIKKCNDKPLLLLYKVSHLRKSVSPALVLSSWCSLSSAIFILLIWSTTSGSIESLSRLKCSACSFTGMLY